MSPLKKQESESESDASRFSPLAFSTQQLKKSESASQSSDEEEMCSGKTIRVKQFYSTDSDTELTSNSSSKKKKESKIHIIDDQLIHSKKQFQEYDSDNKSVVSVHKPISFYSVNSESASEDDDQRIKKKIVKNMKLKKRKGKSDKEDFAPNISVKNQHYGSTSEKLMLTTTSDRLNNDEISSNSEEHEPQFNSKKQKTSSSRKNTQQNEADSNSSDIDRSQFDTQISRELKIVNKDIHKSKHKVSSHGSEKNKTVTSKKQNANMEQSKQWNDVSSSESEESEEVPNNKYSRKNDSHQQSYQVSVDILKHFLEDNPDYEKNKISQKTELRLHQDDEVYIMQIPKTIDPKILKGVSFYLSKKSKLRTEAGKYIIRQQPESPSSVLIFSNDLKKINPVSTFKMEKYVKTKDPKEMVVEEKKRQPLPIKIKVRHPLFGPDYESKIQLEEEIKEKLQQAFRRFDVIEKTSKRKKKNKVEEEEDKSLLISKILEEKFNNVNRSTAKNNMTKEFSNSINSNIKTEFKEEFLDETKQISKKKKKKSNDVDYEEINFEDMFFPKKEVKTEILEEFNVFNTLIDQTESKSKKKKKKPSEKNEESLELDQADVTRINKKKRLESEECFVKQEVKTEEKSNDELEINEESQRRKKKKRDKSDGKITSAQPTLEINEVLGSKKKKRKREQTEWIGEYETRDKIELQQSKDNQKELIAGEVGSHENTQSNEASISKKKKKKLSEYTSLVVSAIKQEQETDTPEASITKKNKKHKKSEITDIVPEQFSKEETSKLFSMQKPEKHRKSLMSSTMISSSANIPDFKVDVSRIETEQPTTKKKKKRKNECGDDNSDLISSLLSTVKNRLESSGDQKKKKLFF